VEGPPQRSGAFASLFRATSTLAPTLRLVRNRYRRR